MTEPLNTCTHTHVHTTSLLDFVKRLDQPWKHVILTWGPCFLILGWVLERSSASENLLQRFWSWNWEDELGVAWRARGGRCKVRELSEPCPALAGLGAEETHLLRGRGAPAKGGCSCQGRVLGRRWGAVSGGGTCVNFQFLLF